MGTASVDESLCIGCGLCESNCPGYFMINEEGIAVVKGDGDAANCDLEEIADMCPVNAISIN